MTCKDCLHYDMCDYEHTYLFHNTEEMKIWCKYFKDKSEWVHLPCKVGDRVFILTSDTPTCIEETKCRKINIVNSQHGVRAKVIAPCVYDDWGGAFRELYANDFGKTVFLTREEAEKALCERRKNESI